MEKMKEKKLCDEQSILLIWLEFIRKNSMNTRIRTPNKDQQRKRIKENEVPNARMFHHYQHTHTHKSRGERERIIKNER